MKGTEAEGSDEMNQTLFKKQQDMTGKTVFNFFFLLPRLI